MSRMKCISVLCIGLLLLTGCPKAQTLTVALDAVVAAVSVGVVALQVIGPATGVPPMIINLVSGYLLDVTTAIPKVADELKTSDPLATQLLKISEILAPYISKNVPGAPPQLAAIITAVGTAIQIFIDQVRKTQSIVSTTPAGAQRAPMDVKLVLTHADRQAIGKTVTKANQLRADLEKMRSSPGIVIQNQERVQTTQPVMVTTPQNAPPQNPQRQQQQQPPLP